MTQQLRDLGDTIHNDIALADGMKKKSRGAARAKTAQSVGSMKSGS